MENRAKTPLAKLTKPRLQEVLPRKRLFRRLDENRVYPAIWVSGPGGSGKTTLVAQYIEEYQLPCLWYQIDPGDSDIATFFYYLGLSGQMLSPRQKAMPLLTPEYILGISTFTRRFFEELFDRLKQPGVLVLDNYQEVPPESALHGVICDVLPVIPENVNVFILSRTSPPPVFARARANNLLQEIGWPALRLSQEEIRDLLHLFGKSGRSENFIDQLHQKTRGWIAGIILFLKHVKSEEIAPDLFVEFSAREIFEYFNHEIFEQADLEIRDFMLSTSIFPEMTDEMAQKLSGTDRVEPILSRIRQNHWFIERYPGSETRYQYHPLFREFLLNRAAQTYTREQMRAFGDKAAGLLAADGQTEAAINLFLESENPEAALSVILKEARAIAIQGRFQSLEQWLGRLPEELLQNHPQVLYWLGTCRLFSDPEQSRRYFEQALAIFTQQKDKTWMCLALAGVLNSISYDFGSFKRLDQWFPRLEPYSREFDQLPEGESKGRLTAAAILAIAIRQPDHPEFETWTKRGMDILEGEAPADIKSQILTPLLSHRLLTGNLAEAEHFIHFFREIIHSPATSPLPQIALMNIEGFYFWVSGRFEASRQRLAEGLDLANATGVHIITPFLLGHGAIVSLIQGDPEEACEFLDRMQPYITHANVWTRECFHFLNLWQALQEDDLPKAALNADLAAGYREMMGMPLTAIINHLGAAIVEHKSGESQAAAQSLDQAFDICHRTGSKQMAFACYLAQAEFALDTGDEAAAREALQKAMTIGKTNQYVTTWLWRPDAMTRLCCKALEAGIEVAYVQDLVRKRNLTPQTPPLEIENWPWSFRLYALGRFALVKDGQPVPFARNARQKPLALLKAIVSFGGRDININSISDFLWPDAEGDVAHGNFKTTLHRLRKILGYHEAIHLNSGRITLDSRYFWVDAWAFERNLSAADEIRQSAANEKELQKAADLTQKALDLYKGPLFQSDEDMATALREHLHHRFIQAVQQLGDYWQNRNAYENALALYDRALKIDDLVEPFHRGVIACHHHFGQKARALAAYERCKKVLAENFDAPPSKETEALKKLLEIR